MRRQAARQVLVLAGVDQPVVQPAVPEAQPEGPGVGRPGLGGGSVVQREDDTEAVTKKRLMVYEDLTQPLVAYYKAEQVFEEVDAAKAPADVTAALSTVIEAAKAAR